MSTRVGTLKPGTVRSIWPVAVVVSVVMLTVAVIAVSLDRGDSGPATTSRVEAPAVATVSGTAANTPSELGGATIPARSGARNSFVRHLPRLGIGDQPTVPTEPIGNNTPSELAGGLQISRAELWARQHVRRG